MLVGITALVPPEVIYSCGAVPTDLNNFVPFQKTYPKRKLCAWTATWREMLIRRVVDIDMLVVVSGGDCYNSLTDGQYVEMCGFKTHYFSYPWEGSVNYMEKEIEKLANTLGDIKNEDIIEEIYAVKKMGLELEKKRHNIRPSDAFSISVSFSDLGGNPGNFRRKIDSVLSTERNIDGIPVALIGIPPIYSNFHDVAHSIGIKIVYDEMPYEFVRISPKKWSEIPREYVNYTFSRPLKYRIENLKKEIKKRNVKGIIHYTQCSCHHCLEDTIIREKISSLGIPMLTVQGDLPGEMPEQIRLRLEAFKERLEGRF